MSGLARSHTVCGTDPGLFLGACTLNSWIQMISKPPSYLHVLPQDTKPYGITVAELATVLLLILSQHLQNALPWPPLPPLQLRQLRSARGTRWGSSVMCHEDFPLACWRDALSNPCSTSLSTKCLWAAASCQNRDLTTAQSFLICCPQHPYSFLPPHPASWTVPLPPWGSHLTILIVMLYCSRCHCAHLVLLPQDRA